MKIYMQFWLIKSEPSSYSIDDLKRDRRTAWDGVRNYQARNYMRDEMKVGDLCLFYHSSTDVTGVYGIAKVASKPHLDTTALDPNDLHFDPKATTDNPIWTCVDVAFVTRFKEPVTLTEIKRDPKLEGMRVRARGSRLSIQPVSREHFLHITKMLAR